MLHAQFSLNTARHCMHSFGVVGPVLRLMHVGKHSITELYLTQLYVFLNVHPTQKNLKNIQGRDKKGKGGFISFRSTVQRQFYTLESSSGLFVNSYTSQNPRHTENTGFLRLFHTGAANRPYKQKQTLWHTEGIFLWQSLTLLITFPLHLELKVWDQTKCHKITPTVSIFCCDYVQPFRAVDLAMR